MLSSRVIPHDAHRGDHLEVGVEGPGRHLEPHLVVALAGAAVGDGVGAVLRAAADEVLHDHRAGQRRHERVAALVERVGRQGRRAVLGGVLLLGVDDDGLDGAGGAGPLLHHLVVLGRLADVDGQRDHLDAEVVDHPADGDGRVEAAAVGEDDALGHGWFLLPSGSAAEPARSDELPRHARRRRRPR